MVTHNEALPKGVAGYRKGCRCEECKAAERERWKRGRERRLSGPVPAHVHGTWNGYTNYGCRCELCLEACRAQYERAAAYRAANKDKVAARQRAYRQKRKAQQSGG